MNRFLRKTEDAVHAWLGGIDTALLRAIAIASVVYMLLAHGFAFTNLFPNHDSTVLVFDAQWTMYVLGRWAQNLYFPLVRGKIAAPWLIGAFSVMYLALAGYIIGRLLHLKHWAAALLTGILGTCASVTAQLATYTYETDAYLLAMLLACVAVWCTECLSNKVGGGMRFGLLSLRLFGSVPILRFVCSWTVSAAAFAKRALRRRMGPMVAARLACACITGAGRGTVSCLVESVAERVRLSVGRYGQRSGADVPAGACGGAGGNPSGVCQLL